MNQIYKGCLKYIVLYKLLPKVFSNWIMFNEWNVNINDTTLYLRISNYVWILHRQRHETNLQAIKISNMHTKNRYNRYSLKFCIALQKSKEVIFWWDIFWPISLQLLLSIVHETLLLSIHLDCGSASCFHYIHSPQTSELPPLRRPKGNYKSIMKD